MPDPKAIEITLSGKNKRPWNGGYGGILRRSKSPCARIILAAE
jgi:hypothetical protein